jgi:hypothetical protein
MIDLLRQVLPYSLIIYFIVRAFKEPLYLLGIPFMMFMNESVFFESLKIFRIPGRLQPALVFIWFVVFWLASIIIRFYKKSESLGNKPKLNELDICIIGLMIVSLTGLVMTIINYSDIKGVLKEFINLTSLFLCYFIIKEWISDDKPEVIVKFFFSLVIVNTISSMLYILNQGLNINIYPKEEYVLEIFNRMQFARAFTFAPHLLTFSVAYLLIFKENRFIIYTLLLALNLLAIFITYTRSTIANTIIIFLLYFVLTGLKKRSLLLMLKNFLIYGLFGVVSFIIVLKVFPESTYYLVNRFAQVTHTKSYSEPNNMKYRFIMTERVLSKVDDKDKILGIGPVTENQVPYIPEMDQATSDLVWTGVIFRWGFVGLIVICLLYILSLIKAFKFYFKSQGIVSELTLFLLLVIISQIPESFVSWTFLSRDSYAIGFWNIAILSAIAGKHSIGRSIQKESVSDE